jgi:vitamin B12 transporter
MMTRFLRSACALVFGFALAAAGAAQEQLTPADDDNVPLLPPQTVVGEPAVGIGPRDFDAAGGQGAGVFPGDTQTVVTPARTEQPASQTGAAISVITGEQLRQSGVMNVGEALRGLPGVDVVRTGPQGGLQSVFLRGANSQNTLVLLDGIPLNDPSNASRSFDFSTLGVDNIERIEVLRGPQSLLYGSNAGGGVINIITARGEGPLTSRTRLMGGSFGTHQERVHASGGTSTYNYSLAGSWLQTDGISAASPRVGGVESDGFEQGTASGRFGWSPTCDFDVDYIFRWIDASAEIDDASFALGQPPTDDPFRLNKSQQFFQRVQLRHSTLDGAIEHRAAFNYADHDRDDTDDAFPFDFEGQTRKFEYFADVLLVEGSSLTVGTDYLDENAASSDPFSTDSASQNDAGLWVQNQVQLLDRLFLTAGHRWDDHSAAGPAKTYRIAGALLVPETGARLHGSIGTSFRAPSLAENLFQFGNPDLLPETSKGWDYGLEQTFLGGAVAIDATYFRNDFRNLILFDLATFTLQNIGTARSHGVELTGWCNLDDVTLLSASYTRTDTLDGDTGQPLVRRPADKGTVRVSRRFLDCRGLVTLDGQFVGDRTDSRDGTVILDDYVVFHFTGHFDAFDDARIFWRVENLFDERYEEITGFQTPPLSIYAGLDLVY